MGNSTLPTVFDKPVIVGSINIRILISRVSDELKQRSTKIEDLSERVKSLEEKQGSLERRIGF